MIGLGINQLAEFFKVSRTLLNKFTEDPECVLLGMAAVRLPQIQPLLLILCDCHLTQDRDLSGFFNAEDCERDC